MSKENNPEIIKDPRELGIILKPVHINKCRTDDYYYNWSSDNKAWMRGEEIPDYMKKAYSSPYIKGHYH